MPSYSMTVFAPRIELCVLIVSNWKMASPPMKEARTSESADQNRPDGELPGPPRRAMPRTIFCEATLAAPEPRLV